MAEQVPSSAATAATAAPQVVIGVAGHVDHGKTSLVQALTGAAGDRLPEERRRGMTIELGFAFRHSAELDLAFIDCPGHERFLHHTLAGAGALDGCLLVISAVEGPCAQTVEHLDVLRLLGLPWGRVVLTKADLADADTLAATAARVAALVADTPFAAEPPVAVSAQRGDGIDTLATWLNTRAQAAGARAADGPARLAIDRVFTVAGHGSVVTGTLRSGVLTVGDAVACFPGGEARIRGLQVAHRAVTQARAGQRTAVNLVGIDREQLTRGAWIAAPRGLQPVRLVDVRIDALACGVSHRQRVEVYHGTARVQARVHLLQGDRAADARCDAQLRLETPLYLLPGDRVVLRRASPAAILGGATILDLLPPRHRRDTPACAAYIDAAAQGGAVHLLAWLDARGCAAASADDLTAWSGRPDGAAAAITAAGDAVVVRGTGRARRWWSRAAWDAAGEACVERLSQRRTFDRLWFRPEDLRNPLWRGVADEALTDRVAALVASGQLLARDDRVTLPQQVPPWPRVLRDPARRLLARYAACGLKPPYDHPLCSELGDQALHLRALAQLRERGFVMQIDDKTHVHRAAADALVYSVVAARRSGTRIDMAGLKAAHDLTRKHAFPLISWLERCHVLPAAGAGAAGGLREDLGPPPLGEVP